MQLEQLINEMRAQGSGECDLDFSVNQHAGRRHRSLPAASDNGLVALARAVTRGATRVDIKGTDVGCLLSYGGIQVRLGAGCLSALLNRGLWAPLELWVNGRRLCRASPRALVETKLRREGDLLGGKISFLPASCVGGVVLVDRGVSFRFGPLLGATRVVARVTPRAGAPWPSCLVLDTDLRTILGAVVRQVEASRRHQFQPSHPCSSNVRRI